MLMKANNETRELGELYTGEMVRKIIAGEKTQTRRPVDMRNIEFIGGRGMEDDPACWGYFFDGRSQHGYMVLARGLDERFDNGSISIPSPRRVGDRIYVRETWGFSARVTTDSHARWMREQDATHLVYRSDPGASAVAWRPSLHMPKWAARIWYEITDVRVQRVQEISEEDARAEGCSGHDPEPRDEGGTIYAWHGRSSAPCPRAHFMCVWDALYGKTDGLSWHQSPWVWAYTFRVLSTTGRV